MGNPTTLHSKELVLSCYREWVLDLDAKGIIPRFEKTNYNVYSSRVVFLYDPDNVDTHAIIRDGFQLVGVSTLTADLTLPLLKSFSRKLIRILGQGILEIRYRDSSWLHYVKD